MRLFVAVPFFVVTSLMGLYVIPRFASVFRDVAGNESLPEITRLVLSIAPASFVVLGFVGAVSIVLGSRSGLGRLIYVVVIILAACALATVVIALALPLRRLIEPGG